MKLVTTRNVGRSYQRRGGDESPTTEDKIAIFSQAFDLNAALISSLFLLHSNIRWRVRATWAKKPRACARGVSWVGKK